MSEDQTEVKMATPEQQEEYRKVCDHIGFYGPVAQNVITNIEELLIICTHSCMKCGKLFTNINPVKTGAASGGDRIVKPKLTTKGILS